MRYSGKRLFNRNSKLITLFKALALMGGGLVGLDAVIAEEQSAQIDQQTQRKTLEQEIGKLKTILEGQTHPINLGRTSLARVAAASTNSGGNLDNLYCGIQNAFDDEMGRSSNEPGRSAGAGWISSDNDQWVTVTFTHPVSITSVQIADVNQRAIFRPITFWVSVRLSDGTNKAFDRVKGQWVSGEPIGDVVEVRIDFVDERRMIRANEILVYGYVPENVHYTVGVPNLRVDQASAKKMVEYAYQQWEKEKTGYCPKPRVTQSPEAMIYTFGQYHRSVDMMRVLIHKRTGKIISQDLVAFVSHATDNVNQKASPRAALDQSKSVITIQQQVPDRMSADAAEPLTLTQQVKALQAIVNGDATPVNLGRTSLAKVSASSVNGDGMMDDPYRGILNAFDGHSRRQKGMPSTI
ncbi:MAG: hypothetical protein CMJ19_17435 [Phycisphaeraceae bacterium]|nr:hypothetical protein [Phycisphaeraceae bacterium]